jgi:TolB-like protein/Tfp pilus assembly protein PilF
MAGLFEELKRRNVVRVGIAYLVAAWLVLQVIDVVLENLPVPPWVMQVILLLTALGFPLAIVFAWAFELTPEGLKRERDVDRSESITPQTGRKLDRLIIVVLIVAVGVLLTDRFLLRENGQPEQTARVETSETTAPQSSRRSIAVLPFANRSNTAEDAFFVDGIHDDILTQLAKISALKVISRTSVAQYRDTEKTMRVIGDELDVATIMEGSVQRAGNRVRINVQLIDAETDEHLWAEVYDRELTASNIFEIQTEMANAIADALHANLTSDEQQRLAAKPTENLEAYEAYLLGRQRMTVRTVKSIAEAKAFFERAINLDPEFALAYVGISDTIQLQVDYSGWSPATVSREAMPYVTKALELDANSGEAYISLASTLEYGGEFDAADDAYRRGLELVPNYAQGHHWYGLFLQQTRGLVDEAYEQFRLANVHDPLSAIIQNNVAVALMSLGRFEEFEATIEKAFEIDPQYMTSHQFRALGYWRIDGRLDLALDWMWNAMQIDPDDPLNYTSIAEVYMDLGDDDRAKCWYDRSFALNANAGVIFTTFAEYSALQDIRSAAMQFGRAAPPNTYGRIYWTIPLSIVKTYLLRDGQIDEARALYEEFFPELLSGASGILNRTNYMAAVDVAEILLRANEEEHARQLLVQVETFISNVPRQGEMGYTITDVRIHTLRGDTDLAVQALRDAVDANWRSHWRYYLDVDTALEPLRSLSEFQRNPRNCLYFRLIQHLRTWAIIRGLRRYLHIPVRSDISTSVYKKALPREMLWIRLWSAREPCAAR